MKKLTIQSLVTSLLLAGTLSLIGGLRATAGEQNNLPAPPQHTEPKMEHFAGKIEDMNVDAKWIKVEKQTYHIAAKTRLLNHDRPIKLDSLKVGTEVHGLARKSPDGENVATIVKVGPRPDERAANAGREKTQN